MTVNQWEFTKEVDRSDVQMSQKKTAKSRGQRVEQGSDTKLQTVSHSPIQVLTHISTTILPKDDTSSRIDIQQTPKQPNEMFRPWGPLRKFEPATAARSYSAFFEPEVPMSDMHTYTCMTSRPKDTSQKHNQAIFAHRSAGKTCSFLFTAS